MMNTILTLVLIVISISLLICLIRALLGPSLSDRIAALDTFGVNLIGFIAILMMLQVTTAYTEVILVIAILSFIGTISLSKFIEGGDVIERD